MNSMLPPQDHEIAQRLGEDTIGRVVAAFYRQIPDDDILGPMYPADDLAGAEARLKSFLIFRLGGSRDYLTERGHPRLRLRHAPFVIDAAARDRWIQLMNQAMQECEVPEPDLGVLKNFFHHVATFLINQPGGAVPS